MVSHEQIILGMTGLYEHEKASLLQNFSGPDINIH